VSVPEASRAGARRRRRPRQSAFDDWGEHDADGARRLLLKLADAIEDEPSSSRGSRSLNCGKPYARALGDEIPAVADVFRFFAGAARCMSGRWPASTCRPHQHDPPRPDRRGRSIAPWNYPLMMAAWKIAPALAAGNTVVLKPSEQTPLTTLLLAQVCAEIFPPGVLNVVTGRGATVGQPLVEHPKVRWSRVTGDVATGRRILQAAVGRSSARTSSSAARRR
jgi:aminobutyraldehyde dehydrogenase